ncbi:spore photoproduct lyase [Natranaerobius thermophilus]|uniref:Radical SAM domain protein n=1 Tax=Natranaerobius thermophilus (strain ATCC BAA-1301 / DSM 18059 / JW/NM-WN-LF) TaxID=457570 RepID=B2A8M2_NATTJ|nr:spore photoproduct lyase [Natranaerobius thermophilus]ACB85906.1 Radical SAM domain protein [Natranaerobius thermophilus JW/NM-WN-LF]
MKTPTKKVDPESIIPQFIPNRVYIEQGALEYPIGKGIKEKFDKEGVPIKIIKTHQRVTGIPGDTREEGYREAKRTLVVGVRKSKDFQTCKPSAHYQLPLSTSCPGLCKYCYLNTTLGKKPYLRVYVNIDDILAKAKNYIDKGAPEETVFEGAATSDPLPVEGLTGNLRKSIEFFAREDLGRFRFVTKFTNVDSLLDLEHNKKTRIRFSLNTDRVIKEYEQGTPGLYQRIEAAGKVYRAGYPIGFIIAPIMLTPGYRKEYRHLLENLREELLKSGLDAQSEIPFELITHRFTARAKQNIEEIFPHHGLPMDESKRRFKYGQFGYGKYVYHKEDMEDLQRFFNDEIKKLFPGGEIVYFV